MTDFDPAADRDRDYLIRSEEQLQVQTDRVVSAYARLEKFVVTETRTFTVEVSHEEFRLVTDPPAPAGSQPRQPDGKNTGRWLTLHREEVVITKRLVPTERVRLEVFEVTEQRQIIEQLRRERIDLDGLHPGPADHL